MYTLARETIKIFWRHCCKYPWHVTVLIVGVLLLTSFQTYIPLLYRNLLNALTLPNAQQHIGGALTIVVSILIANVLRIASWRVTNFVNNDFQPKVMRDLMNTCYRYLQHHSFGFFSSSFVGSLVTKVKRYERSFEQMADQFMFELGRSLIDTSMVLAVLVWQYQTFGIIMLVWCLFFLLFSYAYARFKLPYDIKRAEADTLTTAQLADSISNNVNVKLFSNYNLENKRFAKTVQEQFRLRRKSWNLGTLLDSFQGVFMIVIEFVVMYIAIKQWSQGVIMVGDVALLQVFLGRIFDKLWSTGKNIQRIYEAIADANEMTEMLLLPHEVYDAPNAGALAVSRGEIAFQDVSFKYNERMPVLNKFSLVIQPGERVAFIGPSGGGKSTIAKLLMRFHDVQKGNILIDGKNIALVTQDSLRDQIAFVPQEPILFHRSLMENIRYSRPAASNKDVIRAAKLAHAHEFIRSFAEGYDTLVGERGVKLSGGERQRVAIARAILKDAPILILDEATSSLDSESEMYIQDALKKLMHDRTTIVVAHRLSTIMQMDRIVVIENGHIVEEGKHEELVKASKGTYQRLWEIQAGGFAEA